MNEDPMILLDTIVEEAMYYRFDEEAGETAECGDCGDYGAALCEDHKSDKVKADSYADLRERLQGTYSLAEVRNGTGFPPGMLFIGLIPERSSDSGEGTPTP